MKLTPSILVGFSFVVANSHYLNAAEKLSPNYEKHRILEDTSVGKWAIQGTSDGQKVEGELVGKWAPGKYCVVFSGHFRPVGSEDQTHLSGIIGWDTDAGKIREQVFASDGSTGTAFFEVKDRVLVGKRHGINADGVKYSQDLRFVIGENRWVGMPVKDIGDDGMVLAEHGEWVFTRVK